jgi:hypothetical protein
VKAENHKAEERANNKVGLPTNKAIRLTVMAFSEQLIPGEDERRVVILAFKQLI